MQYDTITMHVQLSARRLKTRDNPAAKERIVPALSSVNHPRLRLPVFFGCSYCLKPKFYFARKVASRHDTLSSSLTFGTEKSRDVIFAVIVELCRPCRR